MASPTTDDDDATTEAARKLFARDCRFIAGAASLDGLPAPTLPEVAFAGRSNVGKSTLINALTGQRALARTSRTPGRTQQINFFILGERLGLVDLPGYGYARASKTRIEAWTTLVHDYLRGRETLRRVVLLIDARHGPKSSDLEVMALLDEAAMTYQVVLTKADKTTTAMRAEVGEALTETLRRRPAAHPEFLFVSAQEGEGIAGLRAALAALAAPG